MFRNRLIKVLECFNLYEAEKLLRDIYAHKQHEDNGTLLSIEEEEMSDELFHIVQEYKKYH